MTKTPEPSNEEAVAERLRDALAYVGYRTEGGLLELAERCELWMRESRILLDMQKELMEVRHSAKPNELADELEWLAQVKFNAECCNSNFPINSLRRVCKEAADAIRKSTHKD